MSKQEIKEQEKKVFEKLKEDLLKIDPVAFCERYLTLDGSPFRLNGNGYKPLSDIYRYVGVKALEKKSKPIVILKSRQTGLTTMASAIEMYFMGCGLFGTNGKPPIRVIHAFPFLELAAAYSKTKLQQMINMSVPVETESLKKGTKQKSYIQNILDTSSPTNDSLHFKQFINGNHLWIESVGLTGDRIMGRQLCLETELPTPIGFLKLKDLKEGDDLFDEKGNVCQVTKLHPINLSPEAYRITFDDGTQVDACADHLWATKTTLNQETKVLNTKQILNNISDGHFIPCELPVYFNKKDRYFIKIDSIDSKPMRCITVDSSSHLFLITKNLISTHNTADVMIFDEIQSTSEQAIANSLKTLTTAKYGNKGVQVLFGTPRGKGTAYHKRWQASTQQYYHLGCSECKNYFPLYTPGSDDWEKIWLHGFIVKCTHCGHEQDKRDAAERGKWFGLKDENDEDVKLIGFHINQLYMPFFTKEDIINEKPGNHISNSEKVYQNEVLGEFFQGDSSPISVEDIREKCADYGRKMTSSLPGDINEIVVIGIDYGAKSDLEQMANPEKIKKVGQSYTTAVVLKSQGAGQLSIEYCLKFHRNDAESKKGIIERMMREYNATLVVGDIGFSQDFSEGMHSSHGDRYLVSRAIGSNLRNHAQFKNDMFPKEIQFARDFYIAEVFEQMKKGMIRFPFGDFEKIAWLIEHCSSMDIKPNISKLGDPSIHYVKGASPNDGLMSLINAYLGYKFIISSGFTKHNGEISDKSIKNLDKPMILGGYVTRKI